MTAIALALILVALVLGIVELIRTRGQSLLAWGVALLALALGYGHVLPSP